MMFGQVSNVSFFCGLGRETTIGNGWGHIFDISMRMGGIGPQGILFPFSQNDSFFF